MAINRQSLHQGLFLFSLLLIVSGLPVSRFMVSLGGLFMAANWIVEGRYRKKLLAVANSKPAMALLMLYLLHVVWLVNTENFDYAAKDLRIKLPLLLFAVVIPSASKLSFQKVKIVIWVFVASVVLASFMCLGHYLFVFDAHTQNIREIVYFNSPIRLALLTVLAILFAFQRWQRHEISGWLFWLIALWLLLLLVILQSVTGLVMLSVLILAYLLFKAYRALNSPLKAMLIAVPILLMLGAAFLFLNGFEEYRSVKDVSYNHPPFETHTSAGTPYKHHLDNFETQNGYYIYRYEAMDELEIAWSKRSDMGFTSPDARGQELRHTLARYLSSMGLRKDAEGLAELTEADIQRVEQGYTSVEVPKNPIARRIKASYFEINAHINGACPQGSSLMQRYAFLTTGWQVARKNILFGVGTGDVNDAMLEQYEHNNSCLDSEHRRRPHNQYLTFLISFGMLGAFYFLWLNLWVIRRAIAQNHLVATGFAIMAALSFLAEDTLETQVGATFFAFFYAYFFLLKKDERAGLDGRTE